MTLQKTIIPAIGPPKEENFQRIFASIVSSSDDAILSKTLDGVITSWNRGAEKIFGYTAREIIGKHISILIPSHLHDEENDIIEKLRNGEAINHYETERVKKDRSTIKVSLTVSPVKDPAGNITGASKIIRDITRQKKAEAELSRSLQETSDYKFALDESSIVAITDQKGIIKHANQNFCNISKYSLEELIGQDHRIINSGHHPKDFIRNLWVTIANGNIWKGEMKNKAKDGTIYWVDTTIVPFLDEKRKPYQYVAIRSDITERKKVEADIIELNRNLEDKITKRTTQLAEANKELEKFSYSVSHDLRAPLRIIDGFSHILLEDYAEKFDKEGREHLKVIVNNARKMGQLIDDLLNFSRLGRSEMTMSKVNMTKLVEAVIQELKEGGTPIPAQLKLKKLKTAKGDSHLLKQVWVNLISNAVKYSGTKKDPVIEIGMMKQKGKDVYYIRDNGAGFDMQYADKLFGVFQRLHKATEFSGTGVGLALAQRIILRHSGKIWAEAKLNEGATFYFTLDHDKST